jgi:serine/threonine protein kinase/Tol biopolymer transport system component
MIDKALSHYRITRKLGAGGMGDVYLATDTTLGRPVALKILPAEYTQDAQRLRRFNQEARAASALNHPNILTIHEVGESEGQYFIATEFIDGQSLRERIESSGKLSVVDALNIATQVASALAAAHEAGIVHRDIKPDNVMIRPDGYVKVLDFGLAKLTEAVGPNDDASDVRTMSGVVVGTTQYMAPEQATGGKVDARSDIFSFGAMLYEMVTGKRAFQGDTPMATVTSILTLEPSSLGATIPPAVANVIQRCLRKDPTRRFQTMADVKAALDDAKDQAATSIRSIRRFGVTAVALAVITGAVLVWQAMKASRTPEPMRAVPLSTLPGIARYPSFSSTGDRVVFTWTGTAQDNPDLWVQQVDGGTPLRLTNNPANDFNPVWSPDGRVIAFLRSQGQPGHHEIIVIPPLGGAERKVAEILVRDGANLTPPYLTWCADSSCLIATDSPGENAPDALFRISLETGEKLQLTHPVSPAAGDIGPTVSTDGQRLVFLRMAGYYVGELFELTLGAGTTAVGEAKRLTEATLNAETATWIPDRREILFSARGSLWRLSTGGSHTPERLPFVGEYGHSPVISRAQPDRPSQLLYVRSYDDANIWRLRTSAPGAPPDSAPAVTIASTRLEDMPHLSPDGRRVAFTSDRSGDWEIWTSDIDGRNAVALTSMHDAGAGYPRWNPNGDQIVYHTNVDGQWEVYVVSVNGGKPRRITDHPASDYSPSFSRDGNWIYFSSNRDGTTTQSLWKVAATGGEPIQLTTRAAFGPQASPDGAFIYYVQTTEAPSTLWRIPVTGGQPERVLEGVYLANFVVLDGGIYYVDRVGGAEGVHYSDLPLANTRLQYYDFRSRRTTTVYRDLGRIDLPITSSADGRVVLFPRLDSSVNDLMLVSRFR